MSTKIDLYFKKFKVEELSRFNIYVIRLFCRVAFKTKDGFTGPYPAIVDTGAPVSLIPYRLWSRSDTEILGNYTIKGIVPKKECFLSVKIGKISCILINRYGKIKPLTIKAYFSSSDEVPLILGFKDLLERAKIHIDTSKNLSYLEYK